MGGLNRIARRGPSSALVRLSPLIGALAASKPWALLAQGPAPAKVKYATISETDAKEWLTYLSSDALQGRQVFTEGYGLAVSYIAEHLKQWGLGSIGDAGYSETVKQRRAIASRATRLGDRRRGERPVEDVQARRSRDVCTNLVRRQADADVYVGRRVRRLRHRGGRNSTQWTTLPGSQRQRQARVLAAGDAVGDRRADGGRQPADGVAVTVGA